jgi:c-di-GMP-related signal transduction protein
MPDLAKALPLRSEILQALQGTKNRERSLLQWLEGHEQGDWLACDAVVQANGLKKEQLLQCYADAIVWADAAVQFAG